jgi:predicted transcriptional regulator
VKRKSLRIDEDLARQVCESARAQGVTESQFMRAALRQAVAQARPRMISEALADYIATADGGGLGDTMHHHEAVSDEIEAEFRRRTRR